MAAPRNREAWAALGNAMAFGLANRRLAPARLAGNHVITGSGSDYALYAHLAPGSVSVSKGETILAGQLASGVSVTPATRPPRTCTCT